MSYLEQISPILRIRNRTGLTEQPHSLEATAPNQLKDFAPMFVFSSMSKCTWPS